MKNILTFIICIGQFSSFGQITDTIWSNNKLVIPSTQEINEISDSTWGIPVMENLNYILKKEKIIVLKNKSEPFLLSKIDNLEKSIVSTYYYPNNQIFHIDSFIKPKGYWFHQTIYYDNGQLHSSAYVPDSIARLNILYHKNGQKQRKHTYVMGALTGPVKEWYPNGQLKMEGQYKIILKELYNQFNDTLEEGVWIYYNEDGTVQKKETYVNGVLQK